MPIIDEERDVLVLRVVYDGPPFSGKTTTLRTLAQGLGVESVTPAEHNGRTLAFDWVDYTGGLFDGRQIRCQIVSVPGQEELARRRRHLLDAADAIVVVADTRRSEIAATFGLLREVLDWSSTREPPIGVVLQANKRDASGAVPREELHAGLSDIAPIGLIETVATSGQGVREAFVFGVRLALDRVRALAESGMLARGRPPVDTAAELYDQVGRIEADVRPPRSNEPLPDPPPPFEAPTAAQTVPPLSFAVGHIDRLRRYDIEDEPRFSPDPGIPGGFIWPPVEGRALLDEASRYDLVPVRNTAGDWVAQGETYRMHSARASLFADVDGGRTALIRWARVHAAHLAKLSPRRVLVLADAGHGRFRLWQVMRVERPLLLRLREAAMDDDPVQLVTVLAGSASQLLRARETLHTPRLPLACTLRTIGYDLRQAPIYVDLVPEQADEDREEPEGNALVERELDPIVEGLFDDRSDFTEIADAVIRAAELEPSRPGLRALAQLVLRRR
jgi:signal recognition particle receptor subunit beta